ncbi:hypothetical protein BO94DRAFT_625973 [Aspergillus sclerotioniger CBS 115572]|uniref:Uncharacterized protein n=1 Tax=Aspergillus sclerotioniger CBS 115572 TaxID=1450535 RepID=A0A317W779_9EURO|nr:hypothetical protein BO94DRAFT_625973 [Aspergillus sclerotioniger CBS 115572]PWY80868.1 hypothetical protein BO94DRAFT_625973 [Aspergillus sclerotioniger CBS 115572]
MQPQRTWMLPNMMTRTITLTNDVISEWRPIEKLKEQPVEMDEEESKDEGGVPNTRIDFLCENVDDTNCQAIVVMFLQIPFEGTEFAAPDIRALQATENDSLITRDLLSAYSRLQEGNCQHTPAFLGTLEEKQDPYSWVPGGYTFFLGFTKVPGVPLGTKCMGEGVFYNLHPKKKEAVREAFKVAYIAMTSCGVREWLDRCLNHLVWDESVGKVYFVGDFGPTDEEWEWNPAWWRRWNLNEGESVGM